MVWSNSKYAVILMNSNNLNEKTHKIINNVNNTKYCYHNNKHKHLSDYAEIATHQLNCFN